MHELIQRLCDTHTLTEEEYRSLIEERTPETAAMLAEKADAVRRGVYGNAVYVRGLIEISNICKNDCLYCGIRRSNSNCRRYRLEPDEIVARAAWGHARGFRTVVLQGGEDVFFTDEILCSVVERISAACPGTAVTLSMGERSRESYRRLFEAGAARYLLRHETADKRHYEKLHPKEMSFDRRMRCLHDLRDIGYQVGCGFMVGAPFQTSAELAKDLRFIEDFRPDMCGIGPFIPHHDTPFRAQPAGSLELTCCLLSIIRLICPAVLLPATTALGSIDPSGREKGILAGANVIMPNISPPDAREKYELYDNKLRGDIDISASLEDLRRRMESFGYEIISARGDVIKG